MKEMERNAGERDADRDDTTEIWTSLASGRRRNVKAKSSGPQRSAERESSRPGLLVVAADV